MRRFFIVLVHVLVCLVLSSESQAQLIRIGIHNDQLIQTLVVYPNSGKYKIVADGESFRLRRNTVLYLQLQNGKIKLREVSKHLGEFNEVKLISESKHGSLSLKPVFPKLQARDYSDNFEFKSSKHGIHLVNEVEIEKYLAGVVEAEGGPNATMEYYKAQAILCRTYFYEQQNKHEAEGFQLCDGVHCQAFKGNVKYNEEIYKACLETKGMVVTDLDTNLITAAFHSNSGGQTANSEDVWIEKIPYLRSVKDQYSVQQPNYAWKKKASLKKWQAFLALQGKSELNLVKGTFHPGRLRRNIRIGKHLLDAGTIRSYFKLKSEYFSVRVSSSGVSFQGKGYGHGVGMSQEGAMHMARKGKDFKDIIHFYFKNVRLIPVEEVVWEEAL